MPRGTSALAGSLDGASIRYFYLQARTWTSSRPSVPFHRCLHQASIVLAICFECSIRQALKIVERHLALSAVTEFEVVRLTDKGWFSGRLVQSTTENGLGHQHQLHFRGRHRSPHRSKFNYHLITALISLYFQAFSETQDIQNELKERKVKVKEELDEELARSLSLSCTIKEQSDSFMNHLQAFLERPNVSEIALWTEKVKKGKIMSEGAIESFGEKLEKKRFEYRKKLDQLEQVQEEIKSAVAKEWDEQLSEEEGKLQELKSEIDKLNNKVYRLKELGEATLQSYRIQVQEEADADEELAEMNTTKGQLEQEMKLLKKDFNDKVKTMQFRCSSDEADLKEQIDKEEELIRKMKRILAGIPGDLSNVSSVNGSSVIDSSVSPLPKVQKVYYTSDVHTPSTSRAGINPNSPIKIQVRNPKVSPQVELETLKSFSSTDTYSKAPVVRKPTILDALLPEVQLSPEKEKPSESEIEFRKRFPLQRMCRVLEDDEFE